jgi:hypothetical protein
VNIYFIVCLADPSCVGINPKVEQIPTAIGTRTALTALLPTSQLFCFGVGDPSYRRDSRIWPANALKHPDGFYLYIGHIGFIIF